MSKFILMLLINSVWQIPLLAIIAASLPRLIKRLSLIAQFRLRVSLVLLSLLLPTISSIRQFEFFPSDSKYGAVQQAAGALRRISESGRITVSLPSLNSDSHGFRFDQALLCVYLLATLFGICRFLLSIYRTRNVILSSRQAHLRADISTVIFSLSNQMAIEVPSVHISEAVRCPATVSWPTPRLFLPTNIELFSQSDVRAAVAHELAHVKRHDFYLNLLFEVLCLPFFYNPALHWLKRKLNTSRECLCDEIGSLLTESRISYARALLQLANRKFLAVSDSSLCLSFGRRTSELELRIATLVEEPQGRRSSLFANMICVVALVVASIVLTAPHLRPAISNPIVNASIEAPTSTKADKLIPALTRKSATNFTLTDMNGNDVALSDLQGKVVLLNFWAAWCGGCVIEAPRLVELENTYRKRGVVIVGISMNSDGRASVEPFVNQNQINYPVLLGSNSVAGHFGVSSLPASFLIDRNGKIARSHLGIIDKHAFEGDIQALLNGA